MKDFRKAFALLIVSITILFSACKKDVHCDNAQLCVVNKTGHPVYYCWNCNQYTELLRPDELACTYVGEIDVENTLFYTNSSTSINYFQTENDGNYAMEVDECYEEFVLE